MKSKNPVSKRIKHLAPIVCASVVLGLAVSAWADGPVFVSDDFNRASLGSSWSEVDLNFFGSVTPAPWFQIDGNRLAATNALNNIYGYWAYNTDYQLFSSSHPTDPLETVQINMTPQPVGPYFGLEGLAIHADPIWLDGPNPGGAVNARSGYYMRIRESDEFMQIIKVVTGVNSFSLASKNSAVDFQPGTEYTLRGITDNLGHLRFEVWSTDLNGNPLTLLDSLSATDYYGAGGFNFGAMVGGYGGAYTRQSSTASSWVTWDNFSVSIPEPATATLLLGAALFLLRRFTRG